MRFSTCIISTHIETERQNRRLTKFVSLIFSAGMLFLTVYQGATAQTVHIPDSGLRTVLESALGKEAGEDITQADMQEMTGLDAFESGIRNLTGLEFATNLIELHLGLNQISDVSPLKHLTNLTYLDLHRNQRISDVSPLKDLTNLTWLSLRGNLISDMSPLKHLARLTYLHIGYNRISDVSPLKDLTNLTFLNLDHNQISDVSPLKYLTNLIYLHIDDNKISDMSPLKYLTNLTFLNINDNQILDISSLKDLTNLTSLNLHGNGLLDVSTLQHLTKLQILRLHENLITDISPLKDLTKLSVLKLHENKISDVSPLKNLTELTKLDLHSNEISDVSPLKNLKNLIVLDLSNNHISDFSSLAELIENLVKYDAENQAGSSFRSTDVNRDGIVNTADLISVALNYRNPDFADSARFGIHLDVNSDGVVDVKDLIAVAAEIDAAAAAPTFRKNLTETSQLTAENLARWIALAKQLGTQDPSSQKGIAVLEHLLGVVTYTEVPPKKTALLANYPNPFNPETWIPYQLSKPSQVNVYIHAADGKLVRTLKIGHLPAGIYHSKSRAVYWDGRNELSESVASGVYFYTLTAGDFTATGKMLIRK